MAQFKSPTFGKISGKYGDALATHRKATGRNYLRVASVPSNPRTDKQVAHRAKFGFVNSVLRPFYPVFKINFGGNQGIRYALNIAFHNAIVGEYPNYAIDLENLVFTEGVIDKAANTQMTLAGENALKIDWDTTTLANSNDTDQIEFVLFNENSNQTLMLTEGWQRSAGTCTLQMPAIWKTATIHCWMYFKKLDGSAASKSQYIGSVEM